VAIVQGNIGVVFELTFVDEDDEPIDLRDATLLELIFVKPDCAETTQTPTLTGVKGEVRYVTTATTDLDQSGGWAFYGHAIRPGEEWHTLPIRFEVRAIGV
jgi:hypothetical protein